MLLTERLNRISYTCLASTLLYITNSRRACSFGLISSQLFSLDAAPLSAQSSPSPSSSSTRQPPLDNDQATREFIDFLKPLKYGREIFKQCRAFTESMAYKRVSFVGKIALKWNWTFYVFGAGNCLLNRWTTVKCKCLFYVCLPDSPLPALNSCPFQSRNSLIFWEGTAVTWLKVFFFFFTPLTLTIFQTAISRYFHIYLSWPVTHEFQTSKWGSEVVVSPPPCFRGLMWLKHVN